jgi:S-adenosylmethionine synthetase
VDSFGSGTVADTCLSARIGEVFDLRPGAIQERMGLWDLPAGRGGRFYRSLAAYGHMGRDDLAAPWEDTAPAAQLA